MKELTKAVIRSKSIERSEEIFDKPEPSKVHFQVGFQEGAEWAVSEATKWVGVVPYQCCPVCNGSGKVLQENCYRDLFETCSVCNGAKIIPMYVLPQPPKD